MESINENVVDKIDGIRTRVKDMEEINNLSIVCPPPKSLKIEPSASCNLACSFCYHKKSKRSGFMSLEDFETAIKIAYDYKIPQVGLLFLGEPTLNPSLPEMIYLAKYKYQIPYVFMTSNGIVQEQQLFDIMHSGLDSLKWSVNYWDQKSFKQETGVNAFYTMLKNIKLAASYETKTKLYASSAVYDVDNVRPELQQFIEHEIKPYVYEHYYFKLNNQGGLVQDEHFNTPYCNRLPMVPCPRLFNNSYITWDLKVALCCSAFTDDFIVGDLKKNTFEEIWNGPKMQELRQAHLNKDVSHIICGGHK